MSIAQNPLRQNHPFKQEHYDELRKVLPKQEITPQTPMAEVYYQAGIEKVLEMILRRVHGGQFGGN